LARWLVAGPTLVRVRVLVCAVVGGGAHVGKG
jgi:hypothetical protein